MNNFSNISLLGVFINSVTFFYVFLYRYDKRPYLKLYRVTAYVVMCIMVVTITRILGGQDKPENFYTIHEFAYQLGFCVVVVSYGGNVAFIVDGFTVQYQLLISKIREHT